MLFKEIITVYSEDHRKPVNAELLIVKASDTYSTIGL
jgi:hypothetical protein